MPRYPIGAVARLTGLTVDTLRVWERRYGVVRPTRDDRGRMYSEADVHRLQLLASVAARGHAIGRLARMSDEDLQALLTATPGARPEEAASGPAGAPVIDGLLAAVRAFDAQAVDREIARLALVLPPRDLVHRVLLPAMRLVGDEWHAGRISSAQEHLLSASMRSLIGAMTRLAASDRTYARMLFATPAGERHEFGILAGSLLAAVAGVGVIYLGPDLPAAQILEAAERTQPHVIVLGLIYAMGEPRPMDVVREIAGRVPPATELWIGGHGPALEGLPHRPGLQILPDFSAFEAQLLRFAPRG